MYMASKATLWKADTASGFKSVYFNRLKSYQAKVRHGGKQVSLGCFVTAEEAALGKPMRGRRRGGRLWRRQQQRHRR